MILETGVPLAEMAFRTRINVNVYGYSNSNTIPTNHITQRRTPTMIVLPKMAMGFFTTPNS